MRTAQRSVREKRRGRACFIGSLVLGACSSSELQPADTGGDGSNGGGDAQTGANAAGAGGALGGAGASGSAESAGSTAQNPTGSGGDAKVDAGGKVGAS